jgi:Protein of unknown function (DUF1091)
MKTNASIVTVNLTLKTNGSKHVYDMDAHFLKDIGMTLMVIRFQRILLEIILTLFNLQLKTTCYRVINKSPMKLLEFPKFNYCDLRRGAFGALSAYKTIFESYYQYGNLTMPCPLKMGHYYMRNVWVDLSLYPSYVLKLGSGLYLLSTIVSEEYRGKSFWLMSNDMYMQLTVV